MWRFKFLVAGGLLLAILLAVFSTAKPTMSGGMPSLAYRQPEVWQGQTTLFITQPGFPWGRVSASSTAPSNGSYLEAGGLASLTTLYARLASSDAIRSRLHLPRTESVSAQPVVDESEHILPMVGILGLAPSPKDAARLAIRAAGAFRAYVRQEQHDALIPPDQRVTLQVVNRLSPPVLLIGHKKTVPIMAFLVVLIATIGAAFVLENLRPEVRQTAEEEERREEPQSLRRTA